MCGRNKHRYFYIRLFFKFKPHQKYESRMFIVIINLVGIETEGKCKYVLSEEVKISTFTFNFFIQTTPKLRIMRFSSSHVITLKTVSNWWKINRNWKRENVNFLRNKNEIFTFAFSHSNYSKNTNRASSHVLKLEKFREKMYNGGKSKSRYFHI